MDKDFMNKMFYIMQNTSLNSVFCLLVLFWPLLQKNCITCLFWSNWRFFLCNFFYIHISSKLLIYWNTGIDRFMLKPKLLDIKMYMLKWNIFRNLKIECTAWKTPVCNMTMGYIFWSKVRYSSSSYF